MLLVTVVMYSYDCKTRVGKTYRAQFSHARKLKQTRIYNMHKTCAVSPEESFKKLAATVLYFAEFLLGALQQ